MKKKSSMLIITMLLCTTAILLINLNTINVKGVTPFNPMPPSPNDNLDWGFDDNTSIGWHLDVFNGDTPMLTANLKYNISNIALMNTTDVSHEIYTVQLKQLYFNWTTEKLTEYLNLTTNPIINCSMVNLTVSGPITGEFTGVSAPTGGPEALLIAPFIPRNNTALMLDWCGERLKNDFGYYLWDDNPILTTLVSPDNNLILLQNSSFSGEYVRMIYYDNGTLKTGELNTTVRGLYPAFLRYNYTRITDLLPHGVDNYWDFGGVDQVMGWQMAGGPWGELDLIYNISDIGIIDNPTGNGLPYNGITLKSMYWNGTEGGLREQTNLTAYPLSNYSLIHYENEVMEATSFGAMVIFTNVFIPKNGSDQLDLHWCADAMTRSNLAAMLGLDIVIVNNSTRNIHLEGSGTGFYLDMTYLSDGSLSYGEIYADFGPGPSIMNYTRFYNFDPFDEIGEWTVEVGDVLYMGFNSNETKFEIIDIINASINSEMGMLHASQVIANVSVWNHTLEVWVITEVNATVGSASEAYPILLMDESGSFPIMVPNGTTGEEMASIFSLYVQHTPDFDQVEYGDYWFRIVNTTNPGSGYFEFFENGILSYAYIEGIKFMADSIEDTNVIFYKNATILGVGIHTIELGIVDIFNITIDIALNDNTLLLFAGFDKNPFNVTLTNGHLFIDIMLNASANLNQVLESPINITITYDTSKLENVKIMWFNMSADGGNGTWEEVPFTDLGNGTIIISVNHTSVFAFTATSKATSEGPPDDGGTTPTPPGGISFGYYYLVFMAIGILALVG